MSQRVNDVPLVVVSGPDGAGKTTLVKSLHGRLTELGVKTAVASLWDLSSASELPRMFADRDEAQRYLSRVGARSRLHFLLHHLCGALERACAQPGVELVLFDTYWYKYLAAEVCHGAELEALIPAVLGLPTPIAILNLDPPSGITARRKAHFSRYESGMGVATEETFIAFQTRLRTTLRSLVNEQPCRQVELDATEPAGRVLEHALACLKREVAPLGEGAPAFAETPLSFLL